MTEPWIRRFRRETDGAEYDVTIEGQYEVGMIKFSRTDGTWHSGWRLLPTEIGARRNEEGFPAIRAILEDLLTGRGHWPA